MNAKTLALKNRQTGKKLLLKKKQTPKEEYMRRLKVKNLA